MIMKLFINASLPTSSSAFKKVNILFDEKIQKITTNPIELEEPIEETDLSGKIILPGAVDAHCHIIQSHDPSQEIAQITRLALLGGWTTLGELSYFSPLPIYDVRDLKFHQKIVDAASYVDMSIWGNVEIEYYPYHAENAMDLWTKGALGLAVFNPSPNDTLIELSFTEIMDLFLDVYESDIAFSFQGWDQENHAEISFEAQKDAIRKILRRMQENPIHIPRVSSWQTVEFINTISKRSDISFSVNMLDLMSLYIEGFNLPRHHEFEENKDLLHELIRTGKLYMVSHNASYSDQGDIIFAAESPQPFAYSYLWMLSELWKQRKVSLANVIKLCSENSAKRLGVWPQKGCLEAGSDADFVIYNPQENTKVQLPDGQEMELSGSFESVWQKGRQTVENGQILERRGAYLPRMFTPKRRHNKTTWI